MISVLKNIPYILVIIIVFYNCSNYNDEENVTEVNEYEIVNYISEEFISTDYTFNQEGLNKPIGIRFNHISNEFVILDGGNICLYFFSKDGKFLRKVGNVGQGPGDFLKPKFFEIDKDGDIYVYDEKNRNISIFTFKGKFINSFRLNNYLEYKFFVTEDKNIVVNIPERGYYFTVLSRDGSVLKEIGIIKNLSKYNYINFDLAKGIPILDEYGNFYIFLNTTLSVIIYNKNGDFINEIKLGKLMNISNFIDYSISPENLKITVYPDGRRSYDILQIHLFYDVLRKDNKIYILSPFFQMPGKRYRNLGLFILDLENELKINNVLNLVDDLDSDFSKYKTLSYNNIFELLLIYNYDIYLPYVNPRNASIIRFYKVVK
ncbi:hypothetical protein AMJ80_01115 [bacterium SM23_31]|nr:MAG: hypothetical protein AMJ80_01115 [bacterium SM23_31]